MYTEQTEEKSKKSSLQLLSEKLESVREKYADKKRTGFWDTEPEVLCYEEMTKIVSTLVIPNTREDLLEFLPYLKAQSESNISGHGFRDACKAKYKECVLKARTLFMSDSAFEPYLRKRTLLQMVLDFIKS